MPLYAPASSGSSVGDYDTIVEKAVTDSVTNSGTPTADSELTTTLAANSVYLVEFYIVYRSNNINTGITWRLTGPAADNLNLIIGNYTHLVDAGNAVATAGLVGTSTTVWGGIASGSPNTGLDCPLRITVMWPVDAAGGTFAFYHHNTNSGVGRTTSIMAGSFMRVKRLI